MNARPRTARIARTIARVWVAPAIIAAASLLPSIALFMQWRDIVGAFSAPPDSVSVVELKLAPAADALRGRAIAGYLPPRSGPDDDVTARRRFLAQYRLVPVALLDDPRADVVLVDCAAIPDCGALFASGDLEVDRMLEAGWVLARRRHR
jgi:hypothetical protein